MKIWLDDERQPPDKSWTWLKEPLFAFQWVRNGIVSEVSLDHDLGEGTPTGYDLLKQLEHTASLGDIGLPLPVFHIHSANPVGRKNMEQAIANLHNLCQQLEPR